ncbi:hypothetical protein BDK51DRAFT_34721 [Blyttiomyces helicus]|uniref:Uncharacterized protein n=1 Tax=Blyttiomyces helicus TaxID=388810 RepID=A0A4P9WJM6_9FUNG|nr:hypothetical protein BDK51DRAFT_34721 [Blyttiomyces helicus]|eukprot:RKO91728.1 hypothetical protein BDK51DRAFT_34721 [Blyttiomyces helicus]
MLLGDSAFSLSSLRLLDNFQRIKILWDFVDSLVNMGVGLAIYLFHLEGNGDERVDVVLASGATKEILEYIDKGVGLKLQNAPSLAAFCHGQARGLGSGNVKEGKERKEYFKCTKVKKAARYVWRAEGQLVTIFFNTNNLLTIKFQACHFTTSKPLVIVNHAWNFLSAVARTTQAVWVASGIRGKKPLNLTTPANVSSNPFECCGIYTLCKSDDQRVTGITPSGFRLNGSIPVRLRSFTSLVELPSFSISWWLTFSVSLPQKRTFQ